MSLRDKLEVGLKPDAPYRKDNLPAHQQDDPACEEAAAPGDDPLTEQAREECDEPVDKAPDVVTAKRPTRPPAPDR